MIISIPVIFGVITITFFLSRIIPGDPVLFRLPDNFTLDEYFQKKAELGLDSPIIIQYIIYIKDILSGNWGYSMTVSRTMTVWELIWQSLPRSIEILTISMTIAIYVGIKLGKFSARYKNKAPDIMIRSISYIGSSMTEFIIAGFLFVVLYRTGITIFPFHGIKSPEFDEPPTITNFRIIDCIISGHYYSLADYLWHIFIPIMIIAFLQVVNITRTTRSSMLDVLQTDYIRLAQAKGCSKKKVLSPHAIRNAVIPTISVITMNFPRVLASFIPLEMIFELNGIGHLFYKSLYYSDYNLMIGCVFLFAMVVIGFNIIADVMYGIIDPRIRY